MNSEIEYDVTDKYPVVLTKDLRVGLSRVYPKVVMSNNSQLLGCVDGDELIVFSGYASDGYSPVISKWGRHIRLTPTPKGDVIPSVVHDFLRQMSQVEGSPITRKIADKEFLHLMLARGVNKFQAHLYYNAVRSPFGALYTFFGKADPTIKIMLM